MKQRYCRQIIETVGKKNKWAENKYIQGKEIFRKCIDKRDIDINEKDGEEERQKIYMEKRSAGI